MNVKFSSDWFKALEKLHPNVLVAASKFPSKFSADPKHPSIDFKSYGNAADSRARTGRVNQQFRAIIGDFGGGTYLLHTVLNHDEAEHWMQNNKFHVNAATGAFEIVDVGYIEEVGANAEQATSDKPAIFADVRDKDFEKLGIGPEVVNVARLLNTVDQVQDFAVNLPVHVADALIELAIGGSVEDVHRKLLEAAELDEPAQFDPDDVKGAIERPASRAAVLALSEDEDLNKVLAQGMAAWTKFLHPSQHAVAYRPVFNGPARVSGGAGTGKTVCLLHRAKFLLDQSDGKARVLITTFTKNLAANLRSQLDVLEPGLSDRIDVLHVQELSREVLERSGAAAEKSYLSDEKLAKRWQQVVLETGVLQADDRIDDAATYLAEEYEEVVLANGITDRADYLIVKRAGRRFPLNKAARAEVWGAFERFDQLLDESNETTYIRACADAATIAVTDPEAQWGHVLVDEAQDLHPAQWRLLRSVVPEGANDLFVAGDVHQRIYRSYVPLSRVGINILGRSAVLRVNYRTTEETLKLAVSLLHGKRFAELDDFSEEASLAGYRSELFGDEPIMSGFEDASEQYDAVAEQIEKLVSDQGIAPADIAVGVRDKYTASRWRTKLTERGIKCRELGKSGDPSGFVAVGTMHKLKGLEYRYVFLVDVSANSIPPKNVLAKMDDPADRDEFILEERCLLYVAATRAREQLWMSWVGTPSALLPKTAIAA